MNNLIEPSFKTMPYKVKDVVFVRDRWQAYIYLSEHVFPVDMYVSNNDLVMVFKKSETRELYNRWRNREFEKLNK